MPKSAPVGRSSLREKKLIWFGISRGERCGLEIEPAAHICITDTTAQRVTTQQTARSASGVWGPKKRNHLDLTLQLELSRRTPPSPIL